MDLKEVNDLSLVEERKHWWIKTRFLYIDLVLKKLFFKNQNITILEYGCGTAQNIWYMRHISKFSRNISKIVGIDPNLDSNYSPDWMSVRDNLSNDLDSAQKSNLIVAMDVLEHIENDNEVLNDWVQNLEQDGLVLITVPAFKLLWSYHDEFLEHQRRYTKSMLIETATKAGLRPVKVTYAFSFIFPLVLLIRKILNRTRNKHKEGQDLALPNPVVNMFLFLCGKVEKILGGCPLFGTSVVGVFEKNDK